MKMVDPFLTYVKNAYPEGIQASRELEIQSDQLLNGNISEEGLALSQTQSLRKLGEYTQVEEKENYNFDKPWNI
jgi:hypothetical protein